MLEAPHVKAWWDTDKIWTHEAIDKKYRPYTKGYKNEKGVFKKIHAFVILVDAVPVGYIQLYNAYDFSRDASLSGLPKSLSAFDFFIGEISYLRKGIGAQALKLFLEHFSDHHYDHVFADPDAQNKGAIKTYEKAGFKRIKENRKGTEIWMIRKKAQ